MSGRISRPTSDSVPLLLDPIPTDDLDDDITYIPTPATEPQPRAPPLSLPSHDHLPWPSSLSRSLHQLFIKYDTQTYLLTGLGIIAILVVLMTTYWGVTPIHEAITGTNHGSITTTTTPTATTYNNTSMNDQIKRMRVAVILSMWGPPGIDYLSRFLRSMHVSIPPSDLIEKVTLLFLIGMKDDIQDIQKKNITSMWEKAVTTLQTIHPHIILNYYTFNKVNDGKPEPNPVLTRFIAIPDYMRHHRGEYDLLLVADARDVIFQADPFELFLQMIEQRKSMNLRPDKHLLGEPLLSAVDHLAPSDPARSDPIAYRHHLLSTQHILFAWESQTIAENSFNSRIVRTAFGPRELNKIQNEMVSCSGTIIGTVDIMMRYCQQVWRHGLTADKRELFGPDQASHMHLLYTDWINLEHQVMLTDYNDGIIHTIGVLAPNQVHVDQFGRIRDGEGHLPAIVHQFDRFPQLMAIVEGQYPYHPDGYPITKTLVDTSKGVHGPDPSFNPK